MDRIENYHSYGEDEDVVARLAAATTSYQVGIN